MLKEGDPIKTQLTLGASQEVGLGHFDGQGSNASGNSQLKIGQADESACLQHAVQEPDVALVPSACQSQSVNESVSRSVSQSVRQ